jgi:3-oxoacyl-(acyl-carrier-protein) synthase
VKNKIVITGAGAITPLGDCFEIITNKLKNGISGISYIKNDIFSGMPVRHAGLILSPEIDLNKHRPYELAKYAFDKAVKNQNLQEYYDSKKMGIYIGTEPPTINFAENTSYLSHFLSKEGDLFLKKYKSRPITHDNVLFSGMFPHVILSNLSAQFKFSGISSLHLGTCSASAQALGESAILLQNGMMDVMVAGGVSSKVDLISVARLTRVGALALTDRDPTCISRPFDSTRSGFTMSEGAVFFILEREKSALDRGAKPIAYLSGYGAAMDGCSITDPHPEATGMFLSMKRALNSAKINSHQIDYLNAHGTSTMKNDKTETLAIKKTFGKNAYNLDISSSKSMHGHLMSATGAMEVLVSILAIQNAFVPPTINLNKFDNDCDLNYTPNKAKQKNITHVLSNSFGLGGQNCSLIISKYE